ncbi:MAG: hypothetical protein AABY22_24440, partial [Nanoarchaeota archaeon]
MNSRAIITSFHRYQPYGRQYYAIISEFFLKMLIKYKDEFDKFYFISSGWEISFEERKLLKELNHQIIDSNPNLRYYDAYKAMLPQVEENLVLFMDNDMVVYKEGIIKFAFDKLEELYFYALAVPSRNYNYDVVSIIDQIGEYKTDKLKNGNKFCPYWFATRKEL